MKKLSLVVVLILLAMPAFAQDEFVLSNSDIDSLLGGGGNRGGGRGGRGNQNQLQIPDPIAWHADIKNLLKNNKVALDKDQEKALKAFLEKETVAMRTELEAGFNRGGNRGNSNSNQMNMLTDLTATVTKHNTEFLTEVKAGVTPDQASLITKAEKDKKVCSVALDLVNFQQVRARTQQQNNNNRSGGGGGGLSDSGFDLNELLGLPTGGGGGGNRGGNNQTTQFLQMIPDRASCTQSNSTVPQRLAVLGEILTKGKKAFTPDQETKVSALIEARMKLITEELKPKYSNMDSMLNDLNRTNNNNNQNRGNQTQTQTPNPPAPPTVNVQTLTNNIVNTIMQNLGIQTNNNNNNQGGGRGGRGGGGNFSEGGRGGGNFPEGGRGGGNFPEGGRGGTTPAAANANNPQNSNPQGNRGNNSNNFNPQQEILKKTEELYDKVAAMLTPEQGKLVKKVKYDQMKARGPVDRFRAVLEQEGTPLTAEQLTTIQTMLNTQNQAIRDEASRLVTTEIQALEPGAMQAVIDEYLAQQAQQQQQQQNPQQNNRNNSSAVNSVNQNRVAQQIIQKTLPLVSRQKALLEGATIQQIQLRVFTPQQVASYKLSSIQ